MVHTYVPCKVPGKIRNNVGHRRRPERDEREDLFSFQCESCETKPSNIARLAWENLEKTTLNGKERVIAKRQFDHMNL